MSKDPDQLHEEAVKKGDLCVHPGMSKATKIAIDLIQGDIQEIKTNHIAHIEKNIMDILLKLKEVAINQGWIKLIGAFVIVQGLSLIVLIITTLIKS